ncbi:peroxiredoxin-like family protein [uncultured Roseobacter sp.]|uniref:peroxiredoxin-like family protein n=1 Tax=uncultured Roseobacter sp. TaxID=114847 RepID=UPI0026120AC4|nr:peroxiredoxin-like family protein [uncultured Roseobacter sp.]
MSQKLTPDGGTPDLALPLVGGGTFDLADERPESFTMVVFYRGHHCPLCKTYLGELAGLLDGYTAAGFGVVAVSMNNAETAQKSVDDWDIDGLRVAHSLSLEQAQNWGLWISRSIREGEPDVFNEPGLFWIRPDGRLYLADISNMPMARPDLVGMLAKVDFLRENDYPARSTVTA